MPTRYKFSLLFALVLLITVGIIYRLNPAKPQQAIRIGAISSLSGTMAESEKPIVDAVQLAVEEINAEGGLLGNPVEILIADGASNPATFAREAERLLSAEKVAALFGCWTSSSRKAVKPLVEQYDNLLFYPVQYEGLEQSPNIIYAGAAPNQQLVPGGIWAMQQFGKRVFLLGSDYIFPRTANRILTDVIGYYQGEVVAEHYVPLGHRDFASIVAKIVQTHPDVILSTINGDSNHYFIQALLAANLPDTPLLSFSLSEAELPTMEAGKLNAHYLVWGYFQSLTTPANTRFLTAFRRRFGANHNISDPMEAAYASVHLWAQAVREAQSSHAKVIDVTLLHQTFNAPSGILAIDGKTRHLWKPIRIGRILPDNRIDIVTTLATLLRAAPFPEFRGKTEWQEILDQINAGLQP